MFAFRARARRVCCRGTGLRRPSLGIVQSLNGSWGIEDHRAASGMIDLTCSFARSTSGVCACLACTI